MQDVGFGFEFGDLGFRFGASSSAAVWVAGFHVLWLRAMGSQEDFAWKVRLGLVSIGFGFELILHNAHTATNTGQEWQFW